MKLNKEKVISAIQKVDGLIESDYCSGGKYCAIGACLVCIGWKDRLYELSDTIDNNREAVVDLTDRFGGTERDWCVIQDHNDDFEPDDYDEDYHNYEIKRKESVIQFIKDMPEAE